MLLVGGACRVSMSPLQNRIEVGQEAYVVFVASGEGGVGDLFAVRASGGAIYPLTYTRLDESRPALSPDGVVLAFVRARNTTDSTGGEVVLMNLLNGAERTLSLPAPPRAPSRLGWSLDGRSLFVETPNGIIRSSVPPAEPTLLKVVMAETAVADSALGVQLGWPVFALVESCRSSKDQLCVRTAGGQEQPLEPHARDPLRWGADSLGYLVDDALIVRPLGGGAGREVRWADPPAGPRQPTMFSGPAGR